MFDATCPIIIHESRRIQNYDSEINVERRYRNKFLELFDKPWWISILLFLENGVSWTNGVFSTVSDGHPKREKMIAKLFRSYDFFKTFPKKIRNQLEVTFLSRNFKTVFLSNKILFFFNNWSIVIID